MRSVLVLAIVPALVRCSTPVDSRHALLAPAPSSPIVVGPGSGQVLLADLDRDGHLDLLLRHLLQKSVTVRLGDGAGGLSPSAESPLRLDYLPGAMALGDVDGDGVLDLCIASKDSEQEMVHLLIGDGKGGFHQATSSPFATRPASEFYKPTLRLADVDEDGMLDVVTSNGRQNSIEFLRGDGRGRFTPGPSVALEPGKSRHSFALGDVDGDGHLDLVVARSTESLDEPGRIVTKHGDGRGAFGDLPGSSASVLPGPALEALGDVNGDQRPDLVLSHANRHQLSVLWNDGRGRFAPAPGSPFDLGCEAFDVVVADVDGDHVPDLVAATVAGESAHFAANVVVLVGDHRAFVPAPGSPFRASPGAYDLAVGDLDEDGRIDVVTSSFESTAVTLLLGRRPPPR